MDLIEFAAETSSSESWARETGFLGGNESFRLVYRVISEQAVCLTGSVLLKINCPSTVADGPMHVDETATFIYDKH